MSKSKSKKMSKAQKPAKPTVAAAPTASITLSNPAPNTLEWSLPDLSGGRVVVYTHINFGTFDGTTHTKQSGVQIYQVGRNPTVTSWENNTGVGNQPIPAGTWSIMVDHYTAAVDSFGNPDMSTIDNGSFSAWLEGVVFS